MLEVSCEGGIFGYQAAAKLFVCDFVSSREDRKVGHANHVDVRRPIVELVARVGAGCNPRRSAGHCLGAGGVYRLLGKRQRFGFRRNRAVTSACVGDVAGNLLEVSGEGDGVCHVAVFRRGDRGTGGDGRQLVVFELVDVFVGCPIIKRIFGAVGGSCRCAAEFSNGKRLFAAGVLAVDLDRFIVFANGSMVIGGIGDGCRLVSKVGGEGDVARYVIIL